MLGILNPFCLGKDAYVVRFPRWMVVVDAGNLVACFANADCPVVDGGIGPFVEHGDFGKASNGPPVKIDISLFLCHGDVGRISLVQWFATVSMGSGGDGMVD